MGETASNVGFGRYREGGVRVVGIWAGQGSIGVHKGKGAFGPLSSATVVANWKALRDAATSESAFFDKLDELYPAVHTEVMTWPAAVRTEIYDEAADAKAAGDDP